MEHVIFAAYINFNYNLEAIFRNKILIEFIISSFYDIITFMNLSLCTYLKNKNKFMP